LFVALGRAKEVQTLLKTTIPLGLRARARKREPRSDTAEISPEANLLVYPRL
jgi:hypothetical protein